MALDQRVIDAIDLKNLDIPDSLDVLRIECREHVDSDGDDSLWITVVLSDETDEWNFNGMHISDLKLSIHDSLLAHGITLFPYTNLVKRSEWELDEVNK